MGTQNTLSCLINNFLKIIIIHRIPRSKLVPEDWIPIKEDQPRYLRIEAELPSMVNKSMPFFERVQYWKQKLRK
jgi:hypothetical protein